MTPFYIATPRDGYQYVLYPLVTDAIDRRFISRRTVCADREGKSHHLWGVKEQYEKTSFPGAGVENEKKSSCGRSKKKKKFDSFFFFLKYQFTHSSFSFLFSFSFSFFTC
jgi:hypothetical protein